MVNVLCLCGYTQSASIFRGRIAAVRKACSASVSFHFLEPPHLVHAVNMPAGSLVQYDSAPSASSSEEELPRAWWFAREDEGVPGGKRYDGYEETWRLLKETLEKERFDVVLGFSQGAALAGALASVLAGNSSKYQIDHPPLKLAILVSGFAMEDPKAWYFPPNRGKSAADTLHIIGRGDTIVSMERSQTLIDKFKDPRVEFHEGGHFVPSKANFRRFFKSIFDAIPESAADSAEAGPGDAAWREVPSPSAAGSAASTPAASGRSTPVQSGSGKL